VPNSDSDRAALNQIRLIVLPGEDEAGRICVNGVASEGSAELVDPREDIYSLDGDHPMNAARSSVKGV
jgi:hypothetical protein